MRENSFSSLYIGILAATSSYCGLYESPYVSVPFTSGSSLQLLLPTRIPIVYLFQFPLHRDPRCNLLKPRSSLAEWNVSVPFTSGSSLQHYKTASVWKLIYGFSSLYIGILAATLPSGLLHVSINVSVPFTSGSSLQLYIHPQRPAKSAVSVPFTSGSSLQLDKLRLLARWAMFQFPLHRDPRCNLG
mgnify:CR=1 FL=1